MDESNTGSNREKERERESNNFKVERNGKCKLVDDKE